MTDPRTSDVAFRSTARAGSQASCFPRANLAELHTRRSPSLASWAGATAGAVAVTWIEYLESLAQLKSVRTQGCLAASVADAKDAA